MYLRDARRREGRVGQRSVATPRSLSPQNARNALQVGYEMFRVALEHDVDQEGDEGVGSFLLGREMPDEA